MGGYPGMAGKCEECDAKRRLFIRRLPIYAAVGIVIYLGVKAVRSRV